MNRFLTKLYAMRMANVNNKWEIDHLFDMEIWYA